MKIKRIIAAVSAMVIMSVGSVYNVSSAVSISTKIVEDNEYHATGALWESSDDYEIAPYINVVDCSKNENNVSTRATLPTSFDLSTNAATCRFFPPIGNQGEIGSCTGWATTYYQFTYEVNKYKKEITTASNIYSPAWTYNYTNGGVDEGAYWDDSYNVLHNQGALKLVDYPHNITDEDYSFDWSNDVTKMIEALKYRAVPTQYVIHDTSQINNIKNEILNGRVGVVRTNAHGWSIATNSSGQSFIVRGSDYDKDDGGHLLTVVGYDDNVKVTVNGVTLTGAFKLANSWGGEETWPAGNNGYIWVSYDALNSTSAFGTSWQSTLRGNRISVFNDGNYFRFITIKECDVAFVGEIIMTTNDPWNLSLYANPGVYATVKKWDLTNVSSAGKRVNRRFVFDYLSAYLDYDLNDYLSEDWTVRLTGNSNYSTSNINLRIIDNLENPIVPIQTELGSLTNGIYTKTTNISLAKGRVSSYDNNEITTTDSMLVMNYISGTVTFSNLQKVLADFNNDNTVDVNDVIAMNQSILSKKGQIYTITDYVDGWGCSLADIIEEEYGMTIEEYISENYLELNSMNVIPDELRCETYVQ